MKRTTLIILGVLISGSIVAVATSPTFAQGEIYGTVYTDDGDRITGAIRWDKNEIFWNDIIDASKKERVWARDRREGLDLRIFGIQFFRSGRSHRTRTHAQFSIPFGHLAAIEPQNRNLVRLELKNGERLEVNEGADLGSRVRGIVVDGPEGEIKFKWGDLERVEFAPNPRGTMDEQRLYGTLETTTGDFTGYIVWDLDEALASDVLDGEEDGRDREIPFSKIKAIEKSGRKASLVTLQSGDELRLRGTNDVNDDNRGILVTVRDMGTVRVDWREFKRVTFMDPPPSPRYQDYDGGRLLYGTVTSEDGQQWTGTIVWDKDEKYTWESLGGDIQDVAFEIQFEHIARIDKASRSGAKITLRDGISFTLYDSNDVNYRNKGIVVQLPDGETVTLGWNEFASAEFEGNR